MRTEYILDTGKRSGSYLSVKDGRLFVRLPLGMTESDALRLIAQHEDWILKKLSDSAENAANRPLLPESFTDGEEFCLLGKKRKLRYVQTMRYKEPLLTDREVCVFVGRNMTQEDRARLAAEYLTSLCEDRIRQAFDKYSPVLGLYPEKITIKKMTSRWGSCSSSGNISMNLNLICFDQRCIDYVAVHELCHLKHMNHSKEFWGLVSTCIPDYKEIREIMKR